MDLFERQYISAMLEDGITRVGQFLQLLRYSTTGRIVWGDLQGNNFRIGCLAQRASAPEEDLEANLPDQLEESLHAPLHIIE